MTEAVQPPVAKRIPTPREHHGHIFMDEYEWLRDRNDPEVIEYLEAENAYTDAQTAQLQPLRDKLFDEIKSRTQETDMSVPNRMGQWWYYSRTVEGQSYSVQCRVPIADDADWTPPEVVPGTALDGEQVLLDGNREAEGPDFFSLGAFAISEDGNLLAYSTDTVGDERYTLRVKDLSTGELLGDEIPGTAPGAEFDLSGDYLFYLTVDETWRPDTVWRHRVGTDHHSDVVVLSEPDERFWVSLGGTRSRKYLMVAMGSKITSETRVLEADDPTGEFRIVLPRKDGVEYVVEHAVVAGEDRFLILHNDEVNGEKAVNFVLAEAPVDDPTDQRILIDHRHDVRLEDVEAYADHLVLSYRREALTRLSVWELNEAGYGDTREIDFPSELYSVGTASNPEWATPNLRLGYTSFTTPAQLYDLVLATGELRLLKEQPVLGDFDAEAYEEHRDWAIADDGTRIPLSVVRRKPDLDEPGPVPVLLYGYGSYESSTDPAFSVARLSLLDRGVTFVVAHVRGGGELGRQWYDTGKTMSKKNTFTDFIAAARHLVDRGITTREQLVADGGSAGGLLMGAVANMAPELFAGILAMVPFVDPLTSILKPDLPLTVVEWDEWGNPLEDEAVYEYMASYSPYENVTAQHYPAILAVTSLNDTRVLYVEPAKWVAKLRATKLGDSQLLLRTEMSAGHGGVSGRYEKWREVAFEYAWMLEKLGRSTA